MKNYNQISEMKPDEKRLLKKRVEDLIENLLDEDSTNAMLRMRLNSTLRVAKKYIDDTE